MDRFLVMGLRLSASSIYEIIRITLPTCADSVVGRVTREKCDERLEQFARNIIKKARLKLEVENIELVPLDRSVVYMSNHQSLMDVPVLYQAIPHKTLRMVGKTELSWVPFWGRAAHAAGMVFVDRSNREKAVASLKKAAETMASGVSIWISPEGTRSKTGKLGPLKRGGFHLAKQTGCPIVPMAILGTGDVLPRKAAKMVYDQKVRVIFGSPIEVTELNVDELQERVRLFLTEKLEENETDSPVSSTRGERPADTA